MKLCSMYVKVCNLIVRDSILYSISCRHRNTARKTWLQMCGLVFSWSVATTSSKTSSTSPCWFYTRYIQFGWCLWYCPWSPKLRSRSDAKKSFLSCSSWVDHGYRKYGMYYIKLLHSLQESCYLDIAHMSFCDRGSTIFRSVFCKMRMKL